MTERYDVIVVGGGPAGYPAATQAALLGARTLLVEKNGALGGTTTVAGVALPGLFHAWGEQIIAGIGWETVKRSVERLGRPLPDFTQWERPHWLLQVPVSPGGYAATIDETVLAAGVELRLHTMIGAVRAGDHWNVTLCGKEGLVEVEATQLIDATGDADVTALAGFERRQHPRPQPGTLFLQFTGYDTDALDYDLINANFAAAMGDGRLQPGDVARGGTPMEWFLRSGGKNAIHVLDAKAGSSAEKTATEVAGRRAMLRLLAFLRSQPGLETIELAWTALETGVRETFTIDAETRITAEDYTSGRRWEDAVSYSFYPSDVHQHHGDGIDIRPLEPGTVPTIPRSAMIPTGSRNLVVAGRAVAGDQAANSAYRVQASCMAMGQAAGAMAAIGAATSTPAAQVPIDAIHEAVRAHGAIVPGDR